MKIVPAQERHIKAIHIAGIKRGRLIWALLPASAIIR
jgi:hypothetical protein